MKKILILSHRDADGITSAVSYIYNYLEKNNLSRNLKNIYKYSDIVDYEHGEDLKKIFSKKKIDLKNYSQMIITDLSFPQETMLSFYYHFKENLILIDHHKRSDEEIDLALSKKNIKINGIRDPKYAACFLVWKYFKKDSAPDFVKYIQDLDLWAFKLPDTKYFIAGLEDFKGTFTKKTINYVLKHLDFDYFNIEKQKIIEKGKVVVEHQTKNIKEQLYYGKIINFYGRKTFIINTLFFASVFADVFFKEKKYKNIEIIIIWYKEYKTGKFKFSLRKRKESKVDLSLIAKDFNGGGHPGASAFTLNSLSDFKYD